MAKQLSDITGLELIHLDQLYWKPNWVEPPKKEWERIVKATIKKDTWIIDGNYSGTMEIRMERADTIIYLDFSRWICLYRVLKRNFLYHGKVRSDMGKDCPEHFSWEFLRYVFHFPLTKRPKILNRLEEVKKDKNIITLKNTKEVNSLLRSFKALFN